MHLAYYDETGDDGFPRFSSDLFVLSVVYLHYLNWRDAFDSLLGLRRQLKASIGLPIKTEFHTKAFLLNKRPFRTLAISEADRVSAVDQYCDLVAQLDCRIISVVIMKPRITNQAYQVLHNALKYSVQRIENDLDPAHRPDARFLIITDPGRIGKMRRTTRQIQCINYIPSKFGPFPYRREIKGLIEDPLQKESNQSYFIQTSDLVSYITYLYATSHVMGRPLPGRLPRPIDPQKVLDWMNRLSPSLNLQASSKDPFGVMFHP